ncbi:helix-turn-helix domain-containing protein [Rhizobium aethiopicum]|uniref:Transcriptional regulator with XRE-family HTH domain n=1 Tax=Rhizobium aethiopicum TaxID=1138170 RepID=A0A7W6Q7X8_9HYPH|nr:helix-turn-helix domain-containing protein [Rhizobium aethiopicum]MBB4192750.1 transcriptional regulator with XRE-family HTH domain [Rhizobium aethiopicum]
MEPTEMMRSLRAQKLSLREIADRLGVSHQTVFYALGGKRSKTPKRTAANDNSTAGRVVRLSPWNGGCSTTSGMAPVTVPHIPTLDTAEVEPSDRELLLAGLQVASQQVAA